MLENGSLSSPFGEVFTTKKGEFGIIGCGGPPELDTPLEDGKGD